MSDLIISPSILKDAEAIYEISRLSFATPWSLKSIEQELLGTNAAKYVSAKLSDTCIGYGGAWIILDEAHITNIAVHPEYRGIGIGEKILQGLIEICKNNGVKEMTLEVRASNAAALNLYKKFDFIEEGIRKKYYADNNEDAIIMWKHAL